MRIVQVAIAVDGPVLLESLRASQIWSTPPVVQLAGHDSYRLYKVDFCQYGTPWKKGDIDCFLECSAFAVYH
eukprot:3841012-Pyramimonas_sp.AAC.1